MCLKENNPRKVLVIDDEASMRDSCRQVLERMELVVNDAADGKSGLAMMDAFKPDLVILDLKMPGIQGVDVLKELHKTNPQTMIIVITGYPTLESAVEAMKCGAYDFLPKPFTPQELRVVVKRCIEHYHLVLRTAELEHEKEKMRNNFTAMLSHQLKAPLAAVEECIEVLERGIAGALNKDQKALACRIHLRVKHLLTLVEDFLKLSRFETSQKLENVGNVDLRATAVGAWANVCEEFKNKKLEFVIKGPEGDISGPIIRGDDCLIHEVFVNLFSNSMKYTPDNGVVTIEFLPPEGKWLTVAVSDTGPGIPSEEQPFVFDEFFRGKSIQEAGNVPGTGLGLSFVKRVMEAHGGTIMLKGDHAGAMFVLRFPL